METLIEKIRLKQTEKLPVTNDVTGNFFNYGYFDLELWHL